MRMFGKRLDAEWEHARARAGRQDATAIWDGLGGEAGVVPVP